MITPFRPASSIGPAKRVFLSRARGSAARCFGEFDEASKVHGKGALNIVAHASRPHARSTARHPESHFLDLLVDDRPLRVIVGEPAHDLVTELHRPWLPDVRQAVDRLLGRCPIEVLTPGRVALLVCAEDGDLGCGQLTIALNVSATEVTWSDFRWEDGYLEPRPVEHLNASISFDRAGYEAAFADAYERVAEVAYDAHHGRRFLWPWQWGWTLPGRDSRSS